MKKLSAISVKAMARTFNEEFTHVLNEPKTSERTTYWNDRKYREQ